MLRNLIEGGPAVVVKEFSPPPFIPPLKILLTQTGYTRYIRSMVGRLVNILKTNSFFLFGPRGCGKTTLLREILPAATNIDLLDDDTFYRLAQRPGELRNLVQSTDTEWIVIDEVQRVPALLNSVHQLLEDPAYKKRKLKFALTGSSARKLKRGSANLLAGRAFIYNLFPFSIFELKSKISWSLEQALVWGTVPKAVLSDTDEERELFLRSYVDTYLREEITAEQLVRNVVPFRRCLELAAQMNGAPVNFSRIAREIGVEDTTVKNYFSVLEDTLVGYLLPPFERSIRKQQLQSPRYYLFDTGVKRILAEDSERSLRAGSSAFGRAFEHFIILECIRLNSYLRSPNRLSYLRTKDDFEVDLVVSRPSKPPIFVEIKSADRINEVDISRFARFVASVPKSKGIVLSREKQKLGIGNIEILPWQEGLRVIFDIST